MTTIKEGLEELIRRRMPVGDVVVHVLDASQTYDVRFRNEALMLSYRHNALREATRKKKLPTDNEHQILNDAFELADAMDAAGPVAPPTLSPNVKRQPVRNSTETPLDKPAVKLERVTKSLTTGGTAFFLNEVTLSLRPGEILSIIGPNGSGKSTLMRLFAGQLAPDTGSIDYSGLEPDGDDWIARKRRIAYIEQFPPLWSRPLLEVLLYTAAVSGYRGDEAKGKVEYFLERLGLTSHITKRWTQLSGGYRTRFALARCLLKRPRLLLLDEPLAHLDVVSQTEFLKSLLELTRLEKFAVVLTSQHVYEAEAISDQILVLRDGHVRFVGPVGQLLDRERSTVEMACAASDAAVKEALGAQTVTSSMPNRYIATLPAGQTCNDVVGSLSKASIGVSYCRDLSASSRRFMEEDLD